MEEKLKSIIEHYGVSNQQRKMCEEFFELHEAITTYELNKSVSYEIPLGILVGNREHIIEELADVNVLIEQIRLHYGIEEKDIYEVMKNKVDRQINRIKNGE